MYYSANQLIINRFQSEWNGSTSELAALQNELVQLAYHVDSFDANQFANYSMSLILHYLKESHDYYSEYYLPKMELAIASLKHSLPDSHAVYVLELFYSGYKNEFLEHIELEERKLFPYAESLLNGESSINYCVALFEEQHDHEIEDQLESVVSLIQNEYPEVTVDFAFRSFENLLDSFRLDIEIHHRIEEHVFLKRIKDLESRF